MRINFLMIKPLLHRIFKGHYRDLRSIANKSSILCPEERIEVPPAIYLNGTIEKIKSLSPWRNWPGEKLLINGGHKISSPTIVYHIKDVDLLEAFLYSGFAIDNPGFGKQQLLLMDKNTPQMIDKANLVTTWSGSRWFGSLLLDDFPLELIADDPDNNITMISKIYTHELGYRKLLGINHSSLITHARIKDFEIYIDPTHNSHRAARYKSLRTRLKKNFPQEQNASNRKVFIKRGQTGDPRRLLNESEIESFLQKLDFDIIEPEVLSAEEIARRTLNARIVIGIEGSHLSHAQYSIADDATLLVIQPPDRFSMVYKDFTDCLGMKYAFLVADQLNGGFSVSLDELQRILELLN